MCLVVCLHTTYPFFDYMRFDLDFILYNISVIAIPLFFTASGYLLIGRENVSQDYPIRKIFGIVKFVFIFTLIVWVIESIVNRTGFDIRGYARNLVFCIIQKGNFSLFWFFGSLSIIYLFYPLINKLFRRKRAFHVLLLIIFIIQNIAFIGNIFGKGDFYVIQTFRIWNWFTYFMLGAAVKSINIKRTVCIALLVATTILTLYLMFVIYPHYKLKLCEFFYSCPTVVVMVASLFKLISGVKIKRNKLVRQLSVLFLPVYSLHFYVIYFTGGIYKGTTTIPLGGLIYWLIVLIITVAVSYVIMKIPYINKIFKL